MPETAGQAATVTVEEVASLVAGIPAIGHACQALRKVGRRATIAANRITVDDEVIAHLIGVSADDHGSPEARWVTYRITDPDCVRVVAAEPVRPAVLTGDSCDVPRTVAST
ncbi:hypothetical protein [Mycobacterium sp. ACS4331]|uniref:hypothetical protein n=1 Tax=Mycobacterium sp. ACS4331 TaxID=1834121 RepID=UPI0012F98B8D|nr:hypothetical protein [Mycobacterium sp. ACS4331]